MPQLRIPESDEDRREVLHKTMITGQQDAAATPPRAYLEGGRVQEVINFFNDTNDPVTGDPIVGFNNLVTRLKAKRAARSIEVGQSDAAEAVLETYVRDFWEVVKRRTFRLKHPVSVLNFFDLPQDGSVPVMSSRADRRIWARKVIEGETAAVAAGFPPMGQPTAAEVQQKLATAETEEMQITPADREVEEALTAVRTQRARANELIDDIVGDLRHKTRKQPAGSARDILRSYGLQFEFLEGETPDPVTPPPAPPPA